MNRYEVIEKMFKKLGVTVDGEGIWEKIVNDVNSNGESDGSFEVELGRLGNDRQMFFAEINVKTSYDEEDDIYNTDIHLLSVKNGKKIIYTEEIEA